MGKNASVTAASINLDCNCNCSAPEVKQEQKKTDEEYLVSLLSYSTHE